MTHGSRGGMGVPRIERKKTNDQALQSGRDAIRCTWKAHDGPPMRNECISKNACRRMRPRNTRASFKTRIRRHDWRLSPNLQAVTLTITLTLALFPHPHSHQHPRKHSQFAMRCRMRSKNGVPKRGHNTASSSLGTTCQKYAPPPKVTTHDTVQNNFPAANSPLTKPRSLFRALLTSKTSPLHAHQ